MSEGSGLQSASRARVAGRESAMVAARPAMPIIRLSRVGKTYVRGRESVEVLKGIDLEVSEGAFEAFMGPSGSGKSTLLNLIAGLDSPTQGTIEVSGVDLGGLDEAQRTEWRAA